VPIQVTLRRLHVTNGAGKNKKYYSITYSEFVPVALFTQHAMRIRCIVVSSMTSPAVPCIFTLVQKQVVFRKLIIENTINVSNLSTTFLKRLSF
jgi:hypothetical protein